MLRDVLQRAGMSLEHVETVTQMLQRSLDGKDRPAGGGEAVSGDSMMKGQLNPPAAATALASSSASKKAAELLQMARESF